MAESLERSADRFVGDLQYGSDITPLGRLLHKIGLPAQGETPVSKLFNSPITGPTRMVKGGAEGAQGKVWKGTKDVVGGALETGELPGMFFAPEGAGAARGLLPSTEKAGKMLQEVEKVAGHLPLNLSSVGKEAADIQQMAKSGGTMPKVVRDFINRVNRPGNPPLTYSEARKFYENAISKFSPDIRANPIKGKARYMLGKFTKSLDQSIQEAADQVGAGQQYAKAMRAYHNASKFESAAKNTGKVATKIGKIGVGAAAGAAGAKAGYDLYNKARN